MNDVRPAARELQDQVLAAAREGQKRVTRTVRNVTATAQQIRPQLPNLSDVHITVVRLPSPAQLRERAPELIGKLPKADQLRAMAPDLISRLPSAGQLRERTPELIARLPLPVQIREKAPELIGKLPNAGQLRDQATARLAKLPSTSQIKVGAEELVVQFRSVQRQVVGQVRDAATPLAKQVLAQVSGPAERLTRGMANGTAASKDAVRKLEDASEAKPVPAKLAEPAVQPDAEVPAHGTKVAAKPAKASTSKAGPSKAETAKASTTKSAASKAGRTTAATRKPASK